MGTLRYSSRSLVLERLLWIELSPTITSCYCSTTPLILIIILKPGYIPTREAPCSLKEWAMSSDPSAFAHWWLAHLMTPPSGCFRIGSAGPYCIDQHLEHKMFSSQVWLHKDASFSHGRSGVPFPYWSIHKAFESPWDQFAKRDPVRSYWPPITQLQRQKQKQKQRCIHTYISILGFFFRCVFIDHFVILVQNKTLCQFYNII